MKSKLFVVFSTITLFASCEMVQPFKMSQTMPVVLKNQSVCVWKNASQANQCNIEYWLMFWSETEGFSWPERKKQIDSKIIKK